MEICATHSHGVQIWYTLGGRAKSVLLGSLWALLQQQPGPTLALIKALGEWAELRGQTELFQRPGEWEIGRAHV